MADMTDAEIEEIAIQEIAEEELAAEEAQNEANAPAATTGPIEAGFRSASQAVTLDFADEIEAGIDTALDFVGEKEYTSFEDLSNDYNKNLDQARVEFSQNKLDHPTADKVGMGVGIAGSLLLPGAAIVKGASAAQKAATAAKVGGAFGAFGAVGRAEDKVSLDAAMDVVLGTGVGVIGGATISRAISGAGALASKLPSIQNTKKIVNRAFKGIGLNTPNARKQMAESLKRKGVEPIEWLKRISKETDVNGNKLVDNITESYTSIHTKAGTKIAKYATERDQILKSVKVKLNRSDIAKQLKSALVSSKGNGPRDAEFLNGLVDDVVTLKTGIVKDKAGERLGKVLDETDLDALSLSELRKTLDSHIKFDSVANSNAVKKDLRGAFNDITDNLILNNADEAGAKTAKGLRSKMSDLFSLQDSLEKGIEHEQFGDNAIMKDILAGARAKMMTSFVGKEFSAVAQGAAVVLRQMSVSPRVNRSMAFNSLRLSEALPNVAESSLRRLLSIADAGDMVQFNEEVAAIVAESDIRQEPLPRSAKAAIARQDSIIALAQSVDPESAKMLRQAFKDKDESTIGALLNEFSKIPEAQDFFEPGQGFDGKVYSPEEKQQLEEQLKTDTSINYVEKLEKIKDLRVNGTIPNAQPEQRVPRSMGQQPRDKDKHEY